MWPYCRSVMGASLRRGHASKYGKRVWNGEQAKMLEETDEAGRLQAIAHSYCEDAGGGGSILAGMMPPGGNIGRWPEQLLD